MAHLLCPLSILQIIYPLHMCILSGEKESGIIIIIYTQWQKQQTSTIEKTVFFYPFFSIMLQSSLKISCSRGSNVVRENYINNSCHPIFLSSTHIEWIDGLYYLPTQQMSPTLNLFVTAICTIITSSKSPMSTLLIRKKSTIYQGAGIKLESSIPPKNNRLVMSQTWEYEGKKEQDHLESFKKNIIIFLKALNQSLPQRHLILGYLCLMILGRLFPKNLSEVAL